MKQIIRLTESDLHNIVREAVNRILAEEVGALGGTSSFSVNSTGNALGSSDPTGQQKNHIDRPALNGKENKKKAGGNAFSEPIMRQAHNLGDVTDAPTNQVDMGPALKRGGSISVNHANESVIREVNWRNAAASAAMGLSTMFGSPQTTNAQTTQNVQPQMTQQQMTQQRDSVDTSKGINYGDVLRKKGYSEDEIKQQGRSVNPANLMMRNAKHGEQNLGIRQYLGSLKGVSSKMSTKNIIVFGPQESEQRMNYLRKIDGNNASKYKLFYDSNGNTFLMPANYTLQDVQREFGSTMQLGDFDIQ